MTSLTLIIRSLRHHARAHLGALFGAAVGSAVLIGALVVGDSVRGSLRQMSLSRLGSIESAVASGDRFFRAELAHAWNSPAGAAVAPAIQVHGTASLSDGSGRANRVQVLGVDERFWRLASEPPGFSSPAAEEVVLNRALAEQLGARIGDTLVLRVEKPSRLSREAPITPQGDSSVGLRVTVLAIAADEQLGRFSLQANQLPPFNAFVSLEWLGEMLELPDRANLMLAGPGAGIASPPLQSAWQLADADLELRELPPNGGLELRTVRVFLDRPVSEAAMKVRGAAGVLTYFVNELRIGPKAAPYSIVTAINSPLLPGEMPDDQLLINQWLANDLNAQPGDSLALSYYAIPAGRNLEERTNHFTVRAVLPMEGLAGDRTFLPDFPGLEKAESTRDWDSSLPVDLEKIRPQDEEYWKEHRGTPKAFVTLAAGRNMWGNRFGELTAVRYPPGTPAAEVQRAVLETVAPASLGLEWQPVRDRALAASDQAQDFGQLFLGFSFFLIIAALLLMALLFQFGIERRATEIGTLLALGFTPGQVRRLLMIEGAALALAGGLLGMIGGIFYARAMLYGLSTIWRDAVGTSSLSYHAQPSTLAIGAVSAVLVGLLTIWLVLRKQAAQSARALLAEGAEAEFQIAKSKGQPQNSGLWVGLLSSIAAMLVIGAAGMRQDGPSAEGFFLAGALLMISGVGFVAAFLSGLASSDSAAQLSLSGMGARNAARRSRRSLAIVGLLACGSFLIASIGVFRLDSTTGTEKRSSGTGGFALIGESALPIVHDLNSRSGREFFGIDDDDMAEVRFVPFRVRDGEDASCLNLNRAQQPRILGVRPEELSERAAFTFARVEKGLGRDDPWMLLSLPQEDGSVPAIGDAASIQWALGKKVGDTLPYTDERGRQFHIRLVAAVSGSVLQGNLLIAEAEFLARFPSESGYKMFLIDAPINPGERLGEISAALSRAAQDYGLELTPAAGRLAAFNAVQNTYLDTFQVLGGLGLLLGSLGLGVVVLRNVLERRSELGLLLAVGFRARALNWLVLSEHGALLLSGLIIGILAAFVAVLPAVLAPGMQVPFARLAAMLGGVLLSGALWTWLATWLALRGRLLDALRND
jgi:putative ABC transport system permease protein